jgi:hypothetical protein
MRLTGYAPDQDPTTPGIVVDCANTVPSFRGMAGAPGPITGALPALAAACKGAAVTRKLDDTTRMFAGTTTKLYEAGATSWTDRSRVSAYAVPSGYRWSFAQFGDVSLAINKSDYLQSISTASTFADITAAPKASIIESVGQFVLAFDTSESTYGDSPDRWWCSASGDYTDWTPSVATESATGRLISSPGPIRAARRFGEQIAVYKGRGMYLGTYQGAPEVWRFDEVPCTIGAVSQEAVADIGTVAYPMHIFMGFDDFYVFDGSRPTPIGVGWVKDKVFTEVDFTTIRLSCSTHDPVNSRIYFHYPVSGSLDRCVVYNYRTKQWGRDDRLVECALSYSTPGVTYDGLGSLYSTYADIPQLTYNSLFLSTGASVPAIFNGSHVLQSLTGATGTSSITIGDMGEEEAFSTITRVRPLFLTAPDSSAMTNFYRENLGDTLTTDQTTPYGDGKYDVMRSCRWHRVTLSFVGNWEMGSLNVYATQEGEQ